MPSEKPRTAVKKMDAKTVPGKGAKAVRQRNRKPMSEALSPVQVDSEFNQLWKVARIGDPKLMLDLDDEQPALHALVNACAAAPIESYEDEFETDTDGNNPMEWFRGRLVQLSQKEHLTPLPNGWPEKGGFLGGTDMQQLKARAEKAEALLAKKSRGRPPGAGLLHKPIGKGQKRPRQTSPERRVPRPMNTPPIKRRTESLTKIISEFVLRHPEMTKDEATAALREEHPGVNPPTHARHAGEPIINDKTVGLHIYIWKDRINELRSVFPDLDLSCTGW